MKGLHQIKITITIIINQYKSINKDNIFTNYILFVNEFIKPRIINGSRSYYIPPRVRVSVCECAGHSAIVRLVDLFIEYGLGELKLADLKIFESSRVLLGKLEEDLLQGRLTYAVVCSEG